jgi:hypothetical protein
MTDPAEPPNFHSPANIFLQKEVYRLGSQPGLRSLPPSPERDFITLTWGPVIYRTTYAPESQRLILLYLRGLNEEIRKSLPRVLQGSSEQLARLEQCYSSKVFSSQETLHGVDEGFVREAFHDWKVALSVPAIELPVRLRVCMLIDDAVLAAMTGIVDEASREAEDADMSRCPIKVIEENFPDLNHPESVSAAADEPYSGSTTVVLGALVEIYDGMRQGKSLVDYHKQGRVYLGDGKWT